MLQDELKRHFETYVDKMTQGERAVAYASGEVADHIPYSIQSNEEAMADIFGYTTAQWRDDPKVHIDILERRREEFGIVGLASGLRLRMVAQALGANIYFPEVGIDRVVAPAIDSIKDINKLMDIDPFTSPVYLAILERLRILKDAFPEMGIGFMVTGPITIASTVLGADQALRETVKHRDAMFELMDLANYHTLSWVKMFVDEFGGGGCNVCDPFTCSGVLSHKQFVEVSKPKLEELIAGLTELLGKKPGLHICGKTSPLWDEIATLPVVSFSVDNCENLADAKDQLGDKFALVGNVDPVNVMLLGTPEDVVAACKNCILQGSESKLGYNLGTGCQVPIGTPRENFEAFVYAARIYGAGAKKGCIPEGMKAEIAKG